MRNCYGQIAPFGRTKFFSSLLLKDFFYICGAHSAPSARCTRLSSTYSMGVGKGVVSYDLST